MNYFTIPLIALTTVLSAITPSHHFPETFPSTRLPTRLTDLANIFTEHYPAAPTIPTGLIVDTLQIQSPADLLAYTAPVGLYAWQLAPPAVHILADYTGTHIHTLATSISSAWSADLHAHTLVLCADGSLAKDNSTVWCNGVGATSGRHRPVVAVTYIGLPPVLTLPASPVLLTLPAPPRLLTLPAPARFLTLSAAERWAITSLLVPPTLPTWPFCSPVQLLVLPSPRFALPTSPRSAWFTVLETLLTEFSTQTHHTFPVQASVAVNMPSTLDVPADQLCDSARGVYKVLCQIAVEKVREHEWVVAIECVLGLMWAVFSVTRGIWKQRAGLSLEEDRNGTTAEETRDAALSEPVVPVDAQQPSDDEREACDYTMDPFRKLELEPCVGPRRGILSGLAPDVFRLCDQLVVPSKEVAEDLENVAQAEHDNGTLDSPEALNLDIFDGPGAGILGGLAPDLFRFCDLPRMVTNVKATQEDLKGLCGSSEATYPEAEPSVAPLSEELEETVSAEHGSSLDSQDELDISLDTIKSEEVNEPVVHGEVPEVQPPTAPLNASAQGASTSRWSQECQYRPGAFHWSDEAADPSIPVLIVTPEVSTSTPLEATCGPSNANEVEQTVAPERPLQPEVATPKTIAPRVSGAARLFAHALGGSSSRRAAEPSAQVDKQQGGGSDSGLVGGSGGSRASMWASTPAVPITESGTPSEGDGGVSGEGGGGESSNGGNRDGESGSMEGTRRGRRGRRVKKEVHFFALRHRGKGQKDPEA